LWTWLWGRYHVPQNVFLVVKVINCHGIAVEMNALDLSEWEYGASKAIFTRKPVLADLSVVQFKRGFTKIFGKQTWSMQ